MNSLAISIKLQNIETRLCMHLTQVLRFCCVSTGHACGNVDKFVFGRAVHARRTKTASAARRKVLESIREVV